MNELFGANNNAFDYALVVLLYGLMFLLIRYPKPTVELNYRANFFFLFLFWAFLMFTGNYLFYRLGVMAFLPWLNNFLHSVLWVGVCLGWLYYCVRERPLWEQFVLFAFTSFVVKIGENTLLGTWNMDRYLGIDSPYAYIVVMSLVDGFYPVISGWVLHWLARRSTFGVYLPAQA